MKPAAAVSICGEVSDRIMAGIRLAVREPNRAADAMPYALQFGEFDVYENSWLTVAEVAAMRWLQVARAAGDDPMAGEVLAGELWASGCHALAFDPDGRPLAVLAVLSDAQAREVAERLRGRVYLVPLAPWKARAAEAIYRDVLRERAAGFEDFEPCSERSALLGCCEVQTRGHRP